MSLCRGCRNYRDDCGLCYAGMMTDREVRDCRWYSDGTKKLYGGKLLGCSCCGPPMIVMQGDRHWIACRRCGRRSEEYDSEDKAKTAWNEMNQ